MKNIYLILFTVISFQTITAQNVIYGVKGGANYTNYGGSNEHTNLLDYKYKLGFHIGGFAKINLSNDFYVQSELLFSLQGSKRRNDVFITDGNNGNTYILDFKTTHNLYYLNIPIMGKYYVSETFNIEFGPQFGYYIDGEIKNEILDDGGLPQNMLFELDKDYNLEVSHKFDFGINLGIGYDFTNQLGVGLRYNYGLTKIYDGGSPFKNSVFQLSLAYYFNKNH